MFLPFKVDGSEDKMGICRHEFTSLQIPTMVSLPSTLTAKKFTKVKFLADRIYYNFSLTDNQKNTNI